MKNTFNYLKMMVILGCVTLLFSCEKDESVPVLTDVDTLTDVNVNTTLMVDKIYVVLGALQVNATLVIPPGTVLKFYPGARMDINTNGTVQAIGTAALPIVFTSIKDDSKKGDTNGDLLATTPSPKDWGCVWVGSNGSSFIFCEFYYGGGWGDHSAVVEVKKLATITNCTFGYNYGGMLNFPVGALCLTYADVNCVFNSNTFYGNDIPITINANMNFDASNVFHNPLNAAIKNKYNGIFVNEYSIKDAIKWDEDEVPYVKNNHLAIETTASLTLHSGVVIKMYPQTRIDIHGAGLLNHNNAIITSFRDDNNLGDTNGDGSASSPAKGDWDGINLGYGNYMTGPNFLYALHNDY